MLMSNKSMRTVDAVMPACQRNWVRRALVGSLSLALVSTGLTGCASFKQIDRKITVTEDKTAAAFDSLDKMKTSGAVIRHDGPKLSGQMVQVNRTKPLPAFFRENFGYLAISQSLPTMLSEIARRSGQPILIQPGLKLGAEKGFSVEWKGDFAGLLDYLASSRDLFWKYQDGTVYFFKTETRAFNIFVPGGKRSVTASIGLAGIGGGSTSGSANVSSNSEVDAYAAITKSIELMVAEGSDGASATKAVTPNETLGIITVTASPSVLAKVGEFIRVVNDRFAQNVLISVKIYNLTLKKGANAGASASLAYENIARNFNINLTTPTSIAPTSGSPGQLVVNTTPGSGFFGGSQVILQALEQVGDVSFLTSGQVVAANGQPSPLQVANEFTYLASSSTVSNATTGNITTLTPATKTVGFTANFLPMILGDNRIMLQYQINLSSLLSLNNVSSGGSSIQTPNIATQSLQQQAFVRDGQSIVLFGYEQERAASNWARFFPGISKDSNSDRTVMVIIMEVYGGK